MEDDEFVVITNDDETELLYGWMLTTEQRLDRGDLVLGGAPGHVVMPDQNDGDCHRVKMAFGHPVCPGGWKCFESDHCRDVPKEREQAYREWEDPAGGRSCEGCFLDFRETVWLDHDDEPGVVDTYWPIERPDAPVPTRFDSPPERQFYVAARRLEFGRHLVGQHPIRGSSGKTYRVDFAIPHLKIAIEVDGYAYHGSLAQHARDLARQRDIESVGWRFIRFAASEIMTGATRCAHQAERIIMLEGSK